MLFLSAILAYYLKLDSLTILPDFQVQHKYYRKGLFPHPAHGFQAHK